MRTASAILFALAAVLAVGAGWSARQPAAPKGRPATAELEPSVLVGRFDGDHVCPWLFVSDGNGGEVVYRLGFPPGPAKAVALGPFPSQESRWVRVTGVVARVGWDHCVVVTEIRPE